MKAKKGRRKKMDTLIHFHSSCLSGILLYYDVRKKVFCIPEVFSYLRLLSYFYTFYRPACYGIMEVLELWSTIILHSSYYYSIALPTPLLFLRTKQEEIHVKLCITKFSLPILFYTVGLISFENLVTKKIISLFF